MFETSEWKFVAISQFHVNNAFWISLSDGLTNKVAALLSSHGTSVTTKNTNDSDLKVQLFFKSVRIEAILSPISSDFSLVQHNTMKLLRTVHLGIHK